ncbi:hypothetical protein ABZT28_16910 [Streptomyces sp. NPDC005388]|uniref:hypothetical protein n=1 Tax=Streptomyces sp. NPDC005388 TaxID=3156717 RepID=UPI0033AA2CA7
MQGDARGGCAVSDEVWALLSEMGGNVLDVGGHALGVEGRLGQVVVTVRTRPESVPQSFADSFDEHAALVEGAVIHQNLQGECGVADHRRAHRPHLDLDQIAVGGQRVMCPS